MHSNLSCYQLKIGCYKYRLFKLYGSHKAKKKKKTIASTQKVKEGDLSISLEKIIKSQKKTARKEERNNGITKCPERK